MKAKLFQKHDIKKVLEEANQLRLIREAIEKSKLLSGSDLKESLLEAIEYRLEKETYNK